LWKNERDAEQDKGSEPAERRWQLQRELDKKNPKKKFDKKVNESIGKFTTTLNDKIEEMQAAEAGDSPEVRKPKKGKPSANAVAAVTNYVCRYYKVCESLGVHFNKERKQESNTSEQRQQVSSNITALTADLDFVDRTVERFREEQETEEMVKGSRIIA